MNLYKIEQHQNRGYDTYDSAVVVANDEDGARKFYPSQYGSWKSGRSGGWCNSPEDVVVTYLGVAADTLTPNSVIISSFNAG